MTTTTWCSDYWYSDGQQAYDADEMPITPTCPVCESTWVEGHYGQGWQLVGRHCRDEVRHRAALATEDGRWAAEQAHMSVVEP